MQLIIRNIHQRSMEIQFLILIAVVLADGGLWPTTGHYLLIFCIIVKPDEINSLKYSPKFNKNTFYHSDAVVLANGGLLLMTGHYLLTFCIIANEDAINS